MRITPRRGPTPARRRTDEWDTRLATPWSDHLGLRAPVLNAPMGGVAGGKLAAAVSVAGGLGMIGVGSTGSVELIEREVRYPKADELPFGIGLLDWALQRDPALLEAALAASPRLISVSFGDHWTWVEQARSVGGTRGHPNLHGGRSTLG